MDSDPKQLPPACSLPTPPSRHVVLTLTLGAVLVVASFGVGAEWLRVVRGASPLGFDSPWIQGDEHVFIVGNPVVTGEDRNEGPLERIAEIFTRVHEDLYQPIPILTYAVEWSLWSDNPVRGIRRTDVVIHAVNALLVWAALSSLLRRLCRPVSLDVAWPAWWLALVWALHPAIAGAYAAEMGRTHLLSATFSLLSLLLYIHAIESRRAAPAIAAIVVIVAAMLSKPVVGWVLVVFAIEAALLGFRAAVLSWRVWVVGLLCAGFASLTYWTTRESGLIEDAALALFGDQYTRSLVATSLYFRDMFLPAWVSTWHLPDVRTGWTYHVVWIGAAIVAASLLAMAACARFRRQRGISVGIAWFWALLLPVVGIVGARVAAAEDRYLYLPLVGMLLAAGTLIVNWAGADPAAGRRRLAILATVSLPICVAMFAWSSELVHIARSNYLRAERVVHLNPGDPRAVEMMAAAIDFSRDHPTPESPVPNLQLATQRMQATLREATELAARNPQFFQNDRHRAAFHRRLSYQLLRTGDATASLEHAELARRYEPDAPYTWTRLAHAYRALGRWDEARQAYEKLEKRMPADDTFRALRLTEFGDLLLNQFADTAAAAEKFRAALDTDVAPAQAAIGLARCEVLGGSGIDGYSVIVDVLSRDPRNLEAGLVLALFYLRSHEWAAASEAYRKVLALDPAQYEALRGLQEVAANTGDWALSYRAWVAAATTAPEDPTYRSWAAWAAACANAEDASSRIDAILRETPSDVFANYGRMLQRLRDGAVDEAVDWAAKASRGTPLPSSMAGLRVATSLALLRGRGELNDESLLIEAAVRLSGGDSTQSRSLATDYLKAHPNTPWSKLARDLGALSGSPE